MPKLPVLNAREAEKLLLALGFELIRTKGSHHIYGKGGERFVLPFHSVKIYIRKLLEI